MQNPIFFFALYGDPLTACDHFLWWTLLVYGIISSLPHSLFGPLLLTQLIELCKGSNSKSIKWNRKIWNAFCELWIFPLQTASKSRSTILMSHSDTTDTKAKVCSMFQWSSGWTQTLHLRNLYFFNTNANAIQTFDKSNYLFTNLQYQLEESLRIYASLISFSFSSLESFSNSTNLTE